MSLIERDYVMRLTKQLAQLLASILKLRREQRHDEAAQTLEGGAADLLGLDFNALALVDSGSAASLLGDPTRIVTFARLLEELAAVYEQQGDEPRRRARARHAFEMYVEARERRPADADAQQGLERTAPQVAGDALVGKYALAWNAVGGLRRT